MMDVVIHSASRTSAETRLIPTGRPTDTPIVVLERRDDIEYSIDHWGDSFVMHTNDDAVDFRLLIIAEDAVGPMRPCGPNWSPTCRGRRILGVDAFAGHLLIHEWVDAQPRLRLVFRDRSERVIELGTEPHDVEPSANPQWTPTVCVSRNAVAHDADHVVRGGRHQRRSHAAAPHPDTERRHRAVPSAAPVGHGGRRHEGPVRHRPPRRHAARRHRAWRPVRLRRVRGIDATVVLGRPAVAARSRIRLGARAHHAVAANSDASGTSTASWRRRRTRSSTRSPAPNTSSRPGIVAPATVHPWRVRRRPARRRLHPSPPELFASAVAEVPSSTSCRR